MRRRRRPPVSPRASRRPAARDRDRCPRHARRRAGAQAAADLHCRRPVPPLRSTSMAPRPASAPAMPLVLPGQSIPRRLQMGRRQPANPPTSQPAYQPTSQPARQPPSQPANQQTSKPVNHPTSQPANPPRAQRLLQIPVRPAQAAASGTAPRSQGGRPPDQEGARCPLRGGCWARWAAACGLATGRRALRRGRWAGTPALAACWVSVVPPLAMRSTTMTMTTLRPSLLGA
mmetsp:Transcript_61216/g.173869  ORF Transcript_61216/g.173869 Transcript_61216/m.173869 type:complete len:231 (+) Transcript_61216:1492-2184(+)